MKFQIKGHQLQTISVYLNLQDGVDWLATRHSSSFGNHSFQRKVNAIKKHVVLKLNISNDPVTEPMPELVNVSEAAATLKLEPCPIANRRDFYD